ncbi:MAG TPA: alpha/beta fold hydrolase [Pseudonocardiaceae bacterium]
MGRTWTSQDFPVGFFHDLHADESVNFQLNRLYNWSNDATMLDQMRQAAGSIHSYDDLIREFTSLGESAHNDGEKLRAALYLRGAEFFIPEGDPSKQELRRRFIELINEYYEIDDTQHERIPYKDGFLSAYRYTPESPRETILLINGFDAYIEELTRFALVLRDAGYDVIAFDGPGQGTVLEELGTPMTPEWEGPVAAVLDHFGVAKATAIGASLGGFLALRAAAFEKRITKVICFDIMPDFSACLLRYMPDRLRAILAGAVSYGQGRRLINRVFQRLEKRSLIVQWGLAQGTHVMGSDTPYDFLRSTLQYRTAPFSGAIDQDVLLLAGAEDHYVPIDQLPKQIATLTNARSITARLFTAQEMAANHCQLGNIGLALDTMLDWLNRINASTAMLES